MSETIADAPSSDLADAPPPPPEPLGSPAGAGAARCDSPPPAERYAEPSPDPRAALLRLAAEVRRTRSQRLLVEYLRQRRAAC